jgi:hypothetical protein
MMEFDRGRKLKETRTGAFQETCGAIDTVGNHHEPTEIGAITRSFVLRRGSFDKLRTLAQDEVKLLWKKENFSS